MNDGTETRDLEEQISFVLQHPGMSNWLKDSLRAALERDPVSLLNDLEILTLIIRRRADRLAAALDTPETG